MLNHFVAISVLAFVFWLFYSIRSKRTIPHLSPAQEKEIECKLQYDKLKKAILECKTLHVLATIESDVDEFYMIYCNRVEMIGLQVYFRDLNVSLMRKKGMLNDENSYA